MTPYNAEAWNEEKTLPNNFGGKHILVIKFGQFVQYYKRKYCIQKFYKINAWKLVLGPFVFLKN